MPAVLKKRVLGFTLLEVMIAVVILAVGLSSLFTSEAGAVRIAQRARTTTIATLLARCKMGEIEEKIAKEGWPSDTIEDRDECCSDGEREGFKCEWKVERIALPDQEKDEDEEGEGDDDDDAKGGGEEPKPGVIDQLADLSKQDPKDRMDALTGLFTGDPDKAIGKAEKGEKSADEEDDDEGSESTMDPIASMVMEMAFPVMKPVIEEGVRRASVNVKWKEGDREQNLDVVQFLVTEQQLVLPDSDDEDGGVPNPAAAGAVSGGAAGTGAAGTGASGTGASGTGASGTGASGTGTSAGGRR